MPVTRSVDPEGVTAIAPLKRSDHGGSGSFLIRADDGERYWCKALNNPQGVRVPITEQIVGRLGSLIRAPVCAPKLVYIPAALAGWEYRDGVPLTEGWVHGSAAAEPVIETHYLTDRPMDDNARRHAGVYALYDWLWGSDPQWLIRGTDHEYFSHDHGWYLPPAGPDWTPESLAAIGTTANELSVPSAGLDADEIERLAAALESITPQEMAVELSNLPATWPVLDAELDAVVSFADGRRHPVATRLRAHAGAV